MKQILRGYGQLFEFSEFPWHILRNIFLPQDRKTIRKKKQQNPSLRWRRIIHEDCLVLPATRRIKAFNFRWFQQPIKSRGIALTANQRCGQNLVAARANLWDFGSGPILAGPRKRECTRTAKIGPDLRLPKYRQWKWRDSGALVVSLARDFPRNFNGNGRQKCQSHCKKTNRQQLSMVCSIIDQMSSKCSKLCSETTCLRIFWRHIYGR